MRARQVTTNGVSISALVPLDIYQNPFAVTVEVLVTGTVTYNVEVTEDPLQQTDEGWVAGNPVNFLDPTGSGGATAKTATALYALGPNPHRAVRINQTAGTGSIVANIIQAGVPGR